MMTLAALLLAVCTLHCNIMHNSNSITSSSSSMVARAIQCDLVQKRHVRINGIGVFAGRDFDEGERRAMSEPVAVSSFITDE
jgi:hypothetical protein